MSSIKLTADSGGGTFELKAPASSGNTRVLTLPDTGNYILGGRILQVAQATKTDTQTQTSLTTFLAVTGMTVSITPSSSSNKILVQGKVAIGGSSETDRSGFRLVRMVSGASDVYPFIADAASNRARFTSGPTGSYNQFVNTVVETPFFFLDSPSTTSAVSYKIECYHAAGNLFINRSSEDQDSANNGRGTSIIVAMEVAA
tara:strand:+ start:1775 stop:2377 length:603 start_codon:yes stop_codon:yes gene_type:complete